MIIWWKVPSGGGAVSTDPGEGNVVLNTAYVINGVPKLGRFVAPRIPAFKDALSLKSTATGLGFKSGIETGEVISKLENTGFKTEIEIIQIKTRC